MTALESQNIEGALLECVRRHRIVVDALTEKQTAEAFQQAIACGDFTRLIRAGDNAQSVTYIPYRQEQELKSRIKFLETVLRDHGIDPDLTDSTS